MTDKTNELKDAMQKIAKWEMPKTGKYWDDKKTQEMSYAACYGTQGEQLIIQDYAQNALTILAGYDHAAAELRWIPVKTKYPDRPGIYDVTLFDGTISKSAFYVGAFDKSVIAWMPIPTTPYTEPADNIAEEENENG